jgi:ABC-type branched-subunit amino acid transport system ATPase component
MGARSGIRGAQAEKLRLTNVVKRFGGRTVVHIEDLRLGRHAIEGLIGPNGAGKTTLMNLITRKLRADDGKVVYLATGSNVVDLSRKRADRIARLGVVKSNQVIQDFETLTVRDSMLLAVASPKRERFYRLFAERDLRREVEGEVESYLAYFQFANPDGYALSAGEKKLLDIVRCLLLEPRFLLMDEPTAGLSDDQTAKVMELLLKKTSEEELSILIVEHDLDFIWQVCELVHFMAEGQILVQGPPAEIRDNTTLAEKYLGTSRV